MSLDRRALILGAGPTGLSAAYHLGADALLAERASRVGGWCRSIEDHGFTFDMAGHIMFSNDPYVHELYRTLLGDNVHWQDREAWIYSKNVFTRYPFQGSLHGLPPEVITECIVGAIEARYGALRPAAPASGSGSAANGAGHTNGNGHVPVSAQGNGNATHGARGLEARGAQDHRGTPTIGASRHESPSARGAREGNGCSNGVVRDCCADGILEAEVRLAEPAAAAPAGSGEPGNFEEFIDRVWGKGIAKHFATPYNRKLWTVPLASMETSWLGGRVPLPDLEEMIEGALTPRPKPMGPNARFGYPLRGGFQALMDGFLPHLRGELRLGAHAVAIDPARRIVRFAHGAEHGYDVLVSTIPLPELVRLLGDAAPAEVREAAAGLRHVSIRCVNLGIGRPHLTEKHWIYYPEDTVFHRIFVQGNASPHCNPPGGFGLTCEISYSEHKPLPAQGDALIARCVEDCRRVGLFDADDPVWAAHEVDLPYAYVIYDHERKARVETIRGWLAERDIVLAGRYSEWEYYNSDHAFLAGRRAAEQVRAIFDRRRPGASAHGTSASSWGAPTGSPRAAN